VRRTRRARARLNADVNVTSLLDLAFVLLIIFMITAPLMQGGVDVRLPEAQARPLEARDGLMVTVDRRGRIFVDESQFNYASFSATFRSLVARRNPSSIYLRADRGVPYGEVVRVLAVIRTSGVQNVGLVTEQEDVP